MPCQSTFVGYIAGRGEKDAQVQRHRLPSTIRFFDIMLPVPLIFRAPAHLAAPVLSPCYGELGLPALTSASASSVQCRSSVSSGALPVAVPDLLNLPLFA